MSIKKRTRDESEDHSKNYPFSSSTIFPCTFCALLEPDEGQAKYYVCTTRNFNEIIAKWENNNGPEWSRMHKFTGKIIEIDCHSNYDKTRDMALKYMIQEGPENVRSSMPGHVVKVPYPLFYTQHLKSCDQRASPPQKGHV